MDSINRIENQLFVDNESYSQLSGDTGYLKASVYCKDHLFLCLSCPLRYSRRRQDGTSPHKTRCHFADRHRRAVLSYPEQLSKLEEQLFSVFSDKVSYISSDTLYRQMELPLEQITRAANLVFLLQNVQLAENNSLSIPPFLLKYLWGSPLVQEAEKNTVSSYRYF